MADLDGKHVLEIGCGDGRLTTLLAPGTGRWLATDPNSDAVAEARQATPPALASIVEFSVTGGDEVDAPAHDFDLVLFSWSL